MLSHSRIYFLNLPPKMENLCSFKNFSLLVCLWILCLALVLWHILFQVGNYKKRYCCFVKYNISFMHVSLLVHLYVCSLNNGLQVV